MEKREEMLEAAYAEFLTEMPSLEWEEGYGYYLEDAQDARDLYNSGELGDIGEYSHTIVEVALERHMKKVNSNSK